MKRKIVSVMMAALMGMSVMIGIDFCVGGSVLAADNVGVSDEQCTTTGTSEPAADDVVPDANQYKYQKDELAAFCHFGPNTFNEIEWGESYGDRTPDDIFQLEEDFDADTLVTTLKNAGFKKLIVTAKHHDGFCIWPSEYTEYDVASTSYKDGQGDILGEISEACTKQNMDMGLYLSPWDIHDPSYGYHPDKENDDKDYNEYYNNQLTEILSNDKYGNNGHFVEVWMDGAKGSGANAQEYDFNKWFDTIQKYEGKAAGRDADCMLFGAGAYTTVRWIGNELGVAGENTWSKSQAYPDKNEIDSNAIQDAGGKYTVGLENGNQWTVPEADARITSGWFWGNNKKTPKTITELGNMYFNSVGHNATLLLNVPPNNKGKVDEEILNRVTEFGQEVTDTFQKNMAKSATVTADTVRGNDAAFKPGNTVDESDVTYWTTSDGTTNGSLTFTWDIKKTFDVVSIEEAIQKGQHINSYKVEYRTNADDQWTVLKEGQTIGAKRLIRTTPVSAKQVRITVGTSVGKVPMLSEVGVYKASDGFELASSVPNGMEVIDVNEFTDFKGTWNAETGTQYINGTNKYSQGANAEFQVKFTGSKIYLLGTKDPNHGKADVYIDGKLVETIDTKVASRSVGTRIFVSPDLTAGEHTLKLVSKDKPIGVEAAYVINNNGVGMIGLEESSYTMNEEENLDVKIKRVGGTNGDITFTLSPNPGSAIQDDYDTENIKTVTIKDGESEVTVENAATTRRNTNATGDQYFYLQMEGQNPESAILGFNDRSKINIKDADGITKERLSQLVRNCDGLLSDWYTSGWEDLQTKLAAANQMIDNEDATDAQVQKAYKELENAINSLVKREKYTEDDPFVFPWKNGESATLEAEFATELKNSQDSDSDPNWPMQIISGNGAGWASNQGIVNCLAYKDILEYAYKAEKPGTYSVTLTYRSGSAQNKLAWSEKDNKIKEDKVTAGATNSAETKSVTFDLIVEKAGTGTLLLTAPDTNKGPQLDKLVITPKDVELSSYTITASAGENGSISPEGESAVTEGDSLTYKITANEGYAVRDVLVDGESVGKVDTYTFSNVDKAHTIQAEFEFNYYTAVNPFAFPTEKGKAVTLEAEYATALENSNDGDSDPSWPLAVATGNWASNGKFINCLAYKDYVKYAYQADVAGTYSVTLTYTSGSTTNKLAWFERDNKITVGQIDAGATDASQIKTVQFNLAVTEAGAGTLTLTAPDTGKAPRLDKFEIELVQASGEAEPVDKAALQAARDQAAELVGQTDKYTAESLAVLQGAMDEADKVLAEDSKADQGAVDAATEALNKAMGELKEIEKEEPDKENPDNNKPDAGTKNPDKNNQASKSDNVNKAAKTGDNNPVAGMTVLCIAAAGTVVLTVRKKKSNR